MPISSEAIVFVQLLAELVKLAVVLQRHRDLMILLLNHLQLVSELCLRLYKAEVLLLGLRGLFLVSARLRIFARIRVLAYLVELAHKFAVRHKLAVVEDRIGPTGVRLRCETWRFARAGLILSFELWTSRDQLPTVQRVDLLQLFRRRSSAGHWLRHRRLHDLALAALQV